MTQYFERHSSAHTPTLQALWGLAPDIDDPKTILIAVPDGSGDLSMAALTYEQFYELREAVNDLYDHIREDTP